MIHLRGLTVKKKPGTAGSFPYNVPIIQSLDALEFDSDITFLVGENGSGKSTLLESIACAVGSIVVGSEDTASDDTLADVRAFANVMKLTWTKRTRRGFFMRSEDFFGYVKRLSQVRSEMEGELKQIEEDYAERSELARGLARMPYMRELNAMNNRYDGDLDAHSHGESYFTLFRERFVPGGLYLLDEPEAPLSPMRQLALLALLKEMVSLEAQFIIATHSPILMAYPGAKILSFDNGEVSPVAWGDLEHVTITRSFLNDPQSFLNHLLAD